MILYYGSLTVPSIVPYGIWNSGMVNGTTVSFCQPLVLCPLPVQVEFIFQCSGRIPEYSWTFCINEAYQYIALCKYGVRVLECMQNSIVQVGTVPYYWYGKIVPGTRRTLGSRSAPGTSGILS